jgi:hypothetical protein
MAVAVENRPRYRPLSRQARELSSARICYDHLAGRLGVALTQFLTMRDYIVPGEDAAEITESGSRFLTEFGIDLHTVGSARRRFCRLCLDWTERRPHIAGAVGAALTSRCFDLGWIRRMKQGRAVAITLLGEQGFQETFGICTVEKNGEAEPERLVPASTL